MQSHSAELLMEDDRLDRLNKEMGKRLQQGGQSNYLNVVHTSLMAYIDRLYKSVVSTCCKQ